MDRRRYLVDVMDTCDARCSELERWLHSRLKYRLMSPSQMRFYEDLIKLNRTLSDKAESMLVKEFSIGGRIVRPRRKKKDED